MTIGPTGFSNSASSTATRSYGISYVEFLDCFSDSSFIYCPQKLNRTFSWYAQAQDFDNSNDYLDESTVYLYPFSKAKEAVDMNPKSFFFVIVDDSDEEEASVWLQNPTRSSRIVAIRRDNSMRSYGKRLESLFTENMLWENTLDYMVYRNERVAGLIEASKDILGGFLCITDTGFNLIHASNQINPPEVVYQRLVQKGSYDNQEIRRIESDVLQAATGVNSITTCKPCKSNPYWQLHFPIFIQGLYVFHITLVLNDDENLDAAKYRFAKFCRRARALFIRFWMTRLEIDSPCHKVLIGLISGSRMDPDRVQLQLKRALISDARWFRLLLIRFDQADSQTTKNEVSRLAKTLNSGHCEAFVYNGDIVVLEYSEAIQESSLSLHKIIDDYTKIIFNKHSVPAAISQLFGHIDDISFAYQQTLLCFEHTGMFLSMYPEGPAATRDLCVPTYPFIYIFQLLLFEPSLDNKLIEYTFRHSIVELLYIKDAQEGTDVANLLWVYLRNERNASKTASELNMHRNTVMYHVKRVEDHFDISLDSPRIRDFMHLEFVHHFSQNPVMPPSNGTR